MLSEVRRALRYPFLILIDSLARKTEPSIFVFAWVVCNEIIHIELNLRLTLTGSLSPLLRDFCDDMLATESSSALSSLTMSALAN